MKMSQLEKRFVNGSVHSRQVADRAVWRLQALPLKAAQTYLDVGCGTGAAALHVAAECDLRVTGVDVDPDQIRLAQAAAGGRPGARFLVGDATRLPFGDGEFDLVATNKTIHHVPDWRSALAEMVRVLTPGGYLLYADFVLPHWLAGLAARVVGERAELPTRGALQALLVSKGLQLVSGPSRGLAYDGVWRRWPPVPFLVPVHSKGRKIEANPV